MLLPKHIDALVLSNIQVLTLLPKMSSVTVQAKGQVWHISVLHSTKQNWFGLQNLALIPGLVGASPYKILVPMVSKLENLLIQYKI